MVGHFLIFSFIVISLDEIIHFQSVECKKYRNKKAKPKKIVFTENQKVIIFDLDHTIWSFGCASLKPPVKLLKGGEANDGSGTKLELYKDVQRIFEMLHRKKYLIGIASEDEDKSNAMKLLNGFGLEQYITYFEIYPGPKTKHIKKIQQASKVEFKNIVYFDDKKKEVKLINKELPDVLTQNIPRKKGITMNAVMTGLRLLMTRTIVKKKEFDVNAVRPEAELDFP